MDYEVGSEIFDLGRLDRSRLDRRVIQDVGDGHFGEKYSTPVAGSVEIVASDLNPPKSIAMRSADRAYRAFWFERGTYFAKTWLK